MTQIKEALGQWLKTAPQKREKLSTDPHRPSYHFLPPNNWMNDPNGLIYWTGQYHMFYQHNPNNPFWGDIHWGHAVSDDLVHWKDLSPALTPDMPPVDSSGCWSGSAVDNNGIPTFLYTGVKDGEQTTCIATGDDDLLVWQKDQANPILKAPQLPGFHYKDYRDPFVWREGDTWYQVISMTINNQGQVLIYRSRDLREWEYLHPLIPQAEREKIQDVADIWECPNFFQLGNKWVLLVSMWKNHTLLYPAVLIGEFRDLQFYPESYQRLDWGEQCMYAPLTFKDNQERRLMFGWLQEQRSKEAQIEAGWSGVMSLPRVLSLKNNRVNITFAPELQTLRQESLKLDTLTLDKAYLLDGLKSETLELQATFTRDTFTQNTAQRSGITLSHGEEKILVYIDWLSNELVVDTGTNIYRDKIETNSVETNQIETNRIETNPVDLHLFADHSVLEVIANGEVSISCRVYPKQVGGSVELFSDGKSQVRLEGWNLSSIWT